MKTQGFCFPEGRREVQKLWKRKVFGSTDTAGRLNNFENTRFSLPRRPPGGPKPMKIQGIRSLGDRREAQTWENKRLSLSRKRPERPKPMKI